MKDSKYKWNYDSPLGKLIMKLKKLGTAIQMKKGGEMSIDDAEYRWVDDRIKMMEKIKNGAEGGRMLSKSEMSAANALWKVYGSQVIQIILKSV